MIVNAIDDPIVPDSYAEETLGGGELLDPGRPRIGCKAFQLLDDSPLSRLWQFSELPAGGGCLNLWKKFISNWIRLAV